MNSKSNTNLQELYTTMKRIRVFEERVAELFVRGETAGSMLHLSIGEELGPACVTKAMIDGDTFTTHHRGHGIFLARGGDPDKMMAEIAGKKDGYCKGKGGSMHIADMSLGHLGANAIVGGGIPTVVGAALSYKYLNKKNFPYAKKINFNSIRKGEVIGEHEVRFSSGKETIKLNHESFDRALYSEGALTAAKWLMSKKPGLYSMRNVLNFK